MDDRTLAVVLSAACTRFRVPGAQAVVAAEGWVAAAEVGLERVGGDPVRPQSPFPLGSLTKPLTAALVLQLVEDGEVDLDAPVQQYLSDLGGGTSLPAVTCRRLLSHTAGLSANVEDSAAIDVDGAVARRRWIRRAGGSVSTVLPPGVAFSYANPGFVVLGRLVEAVTGVGWAEAMAGMLLAPLGVPFVPVGGADDGRVVPGHVRRPDGRITPVAVDLSPLEQPGGGLALSAGDLARCASALIRGEPITVLATRTAALMCSDQLAGVAVGPFGLADGWGLGWASYGADGHTWGHDGTGEGTSCHVRVSAHADGTGSLVALTTNATTGRQVWSALVNTLRRDGVAVADHPTEQLADPGPRVELPDDWLGRYANGTAELVVERAQDGVRLLVGTRPWARLQVHEGLRFLALADDGQAQVGRFVQPGGPAAPLGLQISARVALQC